MAQAKQKSIDSYISKIEAHLLKKYPNLKFDVIKQSDNEAILFYQPYSDEDDYPILRRVSNIATDALVEQGYRIHVRPAA